MRNRRTLWQIFAGPAAIALLVLVGLLAALIGDGWWDGLSWLLLAIPVGLYAHFVQRG